MQAPQNSRARIVFIVDLPNWAHDIKTRNLMRELESDYDIRKLYQSEVCAADLDEADLILVYFWFQFESMQRLETAFERNRHKVLIGVCSHSEIEGSRAEAGLTVLRQWARPVFAVSRQIYRKCRALLNVPVVYAPNGVDTGFYHPDPDKQPGAVMRVGWAGSLLNHGPGQRGYYDLIVPAVRSTSGVELVTAVREELWRGAEEMRRFYWSLDLYICASSSEGTPNPCLEAAACGVPLLTTRVGNMPELVRHGANGFFVERDLEDLKRKMSLLRDDVSLRTSLGRNIRHDIQEWDWSNRSQAYRQMFEEAFRQNSTINSDLMKEGRSPRPGLTHKSVAAAASKGTSPEQVKAALMNKARGNLSLIPDGFFAQHQELAVTIIMLSQGRLDRTLNAIRALSDSVLIPFKLLLTDIDSTDEVRESLKKNCAEYHFVDLVLSDKHAGCEGGRMSALNRANSEYVMFLDNEVEIFPGTVEHLLYSLELHPEAVGSSGSVVFPDGLVHSCGADYWTEDGVLFHELFGDGKQFDDPVIGRSGNCNWISGSSTMFRRSVLLRYALDPAMRPYHEDLEWCYRLNQMGAGCFYRSVESITLQYHEPPGPDESLSATERRRHSMQYVEASASFYKRYGTIIHNLFDLVPELGLPANPLSVSSARIFLALVNLHGAEWVLEKWDHDELAPLFASQWLLARVADREHTIQTLVAEVAEKEQAVQTLSAGSARDQQSLQTLSAMLAAKQSELDGITSTLGWRMLSLCGRIRNSFFLPVYRGLGLAPREPKASGKTGRAR